MWCARCETEVHERLLTCPSCGEVPVEGGGAGTGFDAELCGYFEADPCREAIRVLGEAGIRSAMVVRSPAHDSSPAEYWIAVRRVDRARAEAALGEGAGSCPLCGAPCEPSDTVCLRCGQPR